MAEPRTPRVRPERPIRHPRRTDAPRPPKFVVVWDDGTGEAPGVVSNPFATRPLAVAWLQSLTLSPALRADIAVRATTELVNGLEDKRAEFAALLETG